MIESIRSEERFFAIIVPHDFTAPGVNFITPHNLSQQVAFIRHETGRLIEPHVHNPVIREVVYTQEVLLLKKGVLKVNFYHDNHQLFTSRILAAGDLILLVSGGHGFEVLEDIEMIEVKQGPFSGDNDKSRFAPATRRLSDLE